MKSKSSSVIIISTLFKVKRISCKASLGLTSKLEGTIKNKTQDSVL